MLENVYTVSCKNKGVPFIRSAFFVRRFPISYIHFSTESPISRGFFVMNEKNSTDFWEFLTKKGEEFQKYSCLNCTRNWFKVDSKTDKIYNKDTYFVRKNCALTTKKFLRKTRKRSTGGRRKLHTDSRCRTYEKEDLNGKECEKSH